MEEIGYNRHGDDLPEPAPKLVRMAEECDRLSAETPASSTQSGRCGGMYNYPERDRVESYFNSIPAIPRISSDTVSA